jgi:uncharacterized protein (TIGR03067 family)
MSRLVLIGVAALSLAFAPAPLPRRSPSRGDDFNRIQGTWVMQEQGQGGNKVKLDGNTRWVLGAGKLEIRDGSSSYKWDYKIDPKSAPRALDMSYRPGGPGTDASELKALYSLDGDTLVIGYSPGSWSKRPQSLGRDEPGLLTLTFRREGR